MLLAGCAAAGLSPAPGAPAHLRAAPPAWRTLPAQRPLPPIPTQHYLRRDGAQLWFGSIGNGAPVILLHGGLSSSRAWSEQVPALVAAGHRVILMDSRGHGRSSLGDRPLSYELLAADVLAVIDRMQLQRPAIVGWSDGAVTALVLARRHGERLGRVYAFGANMDRRGVRTGAGDAPILAAVAPRLVADYRALSQTPDAFPGLSAAVRAMQKAQPDYAPEELGSISVPAVLIAGADHDEFITDEHPAYLARAIPGAELEMFIAASHFAPWQCPKTVTRSILAFLNNERPSFRMRGRNNPALGRRAAPAAVPRQRPCAD